MLDQLQTNGVPEIRPTSSGDFPRMKESIRTGAMFPRQASCSSAFCVSSGRRFNLPTIRSTTLSLYRFAWMRSRSQDHCACS